MFIVENCWGPASPMGYALASFGHFLARAKFENPAPFGVEI